MSDKIRSLRKKVKKKNVDPFEVGDVIRWLGGGRYRYAAIKTEVGWYTTARGYSGNAHVAKIYDYEMLTEMLALPDATDIEFAAEWEVVT